MNKRVNRTIFVIVLFIGLMLAVVLVFGQMDVRAMQGQMNAHHTLSTSTVANPTGTLVSNGLRIWVVQDTPDLFLKTLELELTDRLRSDVVMIPVGAGNIDEESSVQPLLLVETRERDIKWFPFEASSELTIEVVYASDGDLSWRHATSMVMHNNTPTVHARGQLEVTDRSMGLISYKAYHQYLGERIAEEIYQMIKLTVVDPPGS